MEEKLLGKQCALLEAPTPALSPSADNALLPKQKTARKPKKDNLKQKKKLKCLAREERRLGLNEHDPHLLKNKSDEDNSVTTHDSGAQKQKNANCPLPHPPSSLLNRLLVRPPYVSVPSCSKISGDYGHASAIFKRPLIEGSFYLEFIVREDCARQRKTANRSAVRVGICHHGYSATFPLGCEESIAYRSTDGSFVRNGEKVAQGQPYASGDVLGVLMNISPPHKHPIATEINEDSTVSFFKNGKLVQQFANLRQVFYCFGVSLYNYSQVEVVEGESSKHPMPAQARHYYSVLEEPIPYKDLENNKIFKI